MWLLCASEAPPWSQCSHFKTQAAQESAPLISVVCWVINHNYGQVSTWTSTPRAFRKQEFSKSLKRIPFATADSTHLRYDSCQHALTTVLSEAPHSTLCAADTFTEGAGRRLAANTVKQAERRGGWDLCLSSKQIHVFSLFKKKW